MGSRTVEFLLREIPAQKAKLFFLALSAAAALDGLTDDLVMSYQRDDGSYATVTRSVPLEAIVEAPTLRLKPMLRCLATQVPSCGAL